MSTVTNDPVVESTTGAQHAVVVTEPQRSNIIGVVALGLAIVGFIFAALLVTAGIAWMLLFPAIILGVVGLFLRNRRKGAALAAVIIALIGLILSLVGLRLPIGATEAVGGPGVLNNAGVNPFSVLLAGTVAGGTQTPPAAGGTGTTPGGLAVGVNSVDCHTPLATVTGLNITGEICAVSVAVTNNGTDLIGLNSSNISATVDGTTVTADATLGDENLLDVQLAPGDSGVGTVYVNLPVGTTDIDTLTVTTEGILDTNVTVDLGN